MRISLPSPKRRARIEIIPLIDIVFFLLATFVMVSMSMIQNLGVPVRLPAAASAAAETRASSVTLSITEDGTLYLDKSPMSIDQIRAELERRRASDPEIKVFVNGDERAMFGQAVALLDEVRLVGIKTLSIQTKSKR